ncbi:MAG: RNA polymerase sigma factor [Cyclobacteriaceae bacterium]
MLQVKEGDLDKLVILFDRYQQQIFGFLLKLSSDYDASQDLTQNVFIRIMKSRHTYKGEHQFRTWIYQIARNLFYDHYKKEMKSKDVFMKVERMEDIDRDEIESYSEIEEREEQLRKALDQLPDDKREVLVMSRYQGMKYEQIAEVTGLTVSNVKIKVHRAINSLREMYFQTA